MAIYTRKGDAGETSLANGERVAKDSLRVEACGTVDELRSLLGLLVSLRPEAEELITPIQRSLFVFGSSLSGVDYGDDTLSQSLSTEPLERAIDRMQKQLPPLKSFILPGGTTAASVAHLARTTCRRAERRVVSLQNADNVHPQLLPYLNRLSDLLFVLARHFNYLDNREEKIWQNSCR